MCGIAGIFAESGPPPETRELEAMTRTLAHRGPDGTGTWVEGAVGFGHRRLSIIDLEAGSQPMHSPSGRLVITYNGEIYNYPELRAELMAAGHRFRTASDTEVILALVEQRGVDGIKALSGMFAFAIWDRAERRLHLGRDRLGIKPLFLTRAGGRLLFGSEIKALRAVLGATPSLDRAAVNSYFLRQYIGAPGTIFEAIESLPPATVMTVSADATRRRRFWSLAPQPVRSTRSTPRLDRAETARGVAALFDRAVRRHLVSDVPVGVFLSGGIDSTCILAFAAEHAREPLHTFSVGFGDVERVDETAFARLAAERFGTLHHEIDVSAAEGLRVLPHLVRSLDQPLADYAIVPTYIVSRFAAERVKVVLSGEGADELFGGYGRYRRSALIDWVATKLGVGHRAPTLVAKPPLFGDSDRRALLGDAFIPDRQLPTEQKLRADLAAFRPAGAVNAALYADLSNWLADDLLLKVDAMGMLASLEARVPYLDPELVEGVMALPGAMKVGPRSTKRVLRDLGAGRIPVEILHRPKQGFTVPVDEWLRGPLRSRFEQVVLDSRGSWLRRDKVEALWRQLQDGRRLGLKLWSILIFEWWCAEHLNGGS